METRRISPAELKCGNTIIKRDAQGKKVGSGTRVLELEKLPHGIHVNGSECYDRCAELEIQ